MSCTALIAQAKKKKAKKRKKAARIEKEAEAHWLLEPLYTPRADLAWQDRNTAVGQGLCK